MLNFLQFFEHKKLRTSAALNWPLPYLLAGTLSILNFPSLFPTEDLR